MLCYVMLCYVMLSYLINVIKRFCPRTNLSVPTFPKTETNQDFVVVVSCSWYIFAIVSRSRRRIVIQHTCITVVHIII